jgi:hypothetical protein
MYLGRIRITGCENFGSRSGKKVQILDRQSWNAIKVTEYPLLLLQRVINTLWHLTRGHWLPSDKCVLFVMSSQCPLRNLQRVANIIYYSTTNLSEVSRYPLTLQQSTRRVSITSQRLAKGCPINMPRNNPNCPINMPRNNPNCPINMPRNNPNGHINMPRNNLLTVPKEHKI